MINGSEVHIDIYDDRLEIYSPGGMPDGSNIQERDPVTVPSTRRNPVLADVFNRLGYMERKGSGFAKILDNYAFQVNYTEEKKPYFKSDRYQFTVIMPNLNYGGIQDDTVNDTVNNTVNDIVKNEIMNLMKNNPRITITDIAKALNISRPTVTRKIKELKIDNYIYRIGSDKKGSWIVNER